MSESAHGHHIKRHKGREVLGVFLRWFNAIDVWLFGRKRETRGWTFHHDNGEKHSFHHKRLRMLFKRGLSR